MILLISRCIGSYTHYDAFIHEIFEQSRINLLESDDNLWGYIEDWDGLII